LDASQLGLLGLPLRVCCSFHELRLTGVLTYNDCYVGALVCVFLPFMTYCSDVRLRTAMGEMSIRPSIAELRAMDDATPPDPHAADKLDPEAPVFFEALLAKADRDKAQKYGVLEEGSRMQSGFRDICF